jgi:hypothetical protein
MGLKPIAIFVGHKYKTTLNLILICEKAFHSKSKWLYLSKYICRIFRLSYRNNNSQY